MDINLCPLFCFILILMVYFVQGQPGGTTTLTVLFEGDFVIPGGVNNVPRANFDDPSLPEEFRQFIASIPNNLDEVVPSGCQAPIQVGSCSGRSLRWAYDMNSRRCRPFIFRGCNGNQNNFRSRRSCELACPTRCKQNIDEGFCSANTQRWGFNDFTGRCQEFTFGGCGGNTNSFISERDCVETCGDVCLLPILRGPCEAHLPRWGYNFITGQCQQFYYGGCQGNRNSFLNRRACEQTCVPDAFPECAQIDPTFISVGPFGVGCISTATLIPCPPEGCQEGFACCESGCGSMCVQLENPPPPSPCSQMIVAGNCNEAIPRFGFDATMETCRLFTYTGCGGNNNNFETYSECISACVPDICNEPIARGPCNQNIIRWAYNPVTMTCRAFLYGGCRGNNNNFVSPSQCFATCFRGLPEVDVCEQPINEGLCDGNIERYAFNAEVGFCLPHSYGGCGGNDNNFATLLECDARCPPTIPASVCLLPIEVGTSCDRVIVSWGFDIVAGECLQFNYGGCDGNGNRFLTQDTCELRCLGQTSGNLCPDGRPPCPIDPCTTAVCPANPAALCTSDLCEVTRQCPAVFVDILGRPVDCDVVIDLCSQPIARGPCFLVIFSWGYNPSTNQCEMFPYSGCFGNENNFISYAACAERCIGMTGVDVCAQPIAVGSCTNFVLSWGFNSQSGQCELFTYSGCGGNGNNFRTRAQCRRVCEVVDVCALPIDPGPCTAQTQRFAFNSVTGQCEQFTFGGCLGNANNFETLLDCLRRCDAGNVPICDQPISRGICPGQLAAWGFNSATGQCEFFLASQCPGSENIFQSFDECAQECNAPVNRCQQPIQVGGCTQSIERWGYNSATGQCQIFLYSGCSGNANSFDTRGECEQICAVVTNPCFPNPCNGGICSVENDAASCDCTPTFSSGMLCDMPIEIEFQDVLPFTIPEGGQGSKAVCLDSQFALRSLDIQFSLSPNPGGTGDLQILPTAPSIPMGQRCTTVEFFALTDGIVENTETFTITLSSNLVTVDPIRFQFNIFVTNVVTDVCVPNPCGNNGICREFNNEATCDCTFTFFTGEFCNNQIEIQFQDANPLTIPEGETRTKSVCLDPLFPTRSVAIPFSLLLDPISNDISLPPEIAIPAGVRCLSLEFSAVADLIPEVQETFQILLTSTSANVDNFLRQFNIIIPDNVEIEFADITTQTIAEGFSFTRDICRDPRNAPNEVSFSLLASPPNFDVTFSAFGTILQNQMCTSVEFSAVADGAEEGTETFIITLSSSNVNVDATRNQFTLIVTDEPVLGDNPCAQPIDSGPCNVNSMRFAYNALTLSCQSFMYGGCEGNSNNFLSLDDCNLRCVTDVCAQPVISCTGTQTGFSYNSTIGVCILVTLGPTCTSNGNFFATQSACQARCEVPLCSQAIDAGPCSASLERYGYNSVSGQCQQFFFSGCSGTANRFNSLSDCQATCEAEACAQPVIQGPCSGSLIRFYFNPVSSECDTFRYGGCHGSENLFTSINDCQEQCIMFPICTQPIETGTCLLSLPRFGLNFETGQCEQFSYSGCGGTVNRFKTLAACQQRCEADACSQPIFEGPCSGFNDVFAFDTQSGMCTPFNYGGCLGNENLFGTRDLCLNRCIVDLCSLPLWPGPCTGNLEVWGFNPSTGVCEPFIYGGCLGNANRFAGQEACQARCEANFCSQPQDPGPCSAGLQSFSYNSVTNACEEFSYGGCLGSANRFDTLAQCQRDCVIDDVGEVCSKRIDPGPCSGGFQRYFYNSVIGICQSFLYGGCGGNTNNFMSLEACNQRCVTDACAQPVPNCPGPLMRWSYNPLLRQCTSINYDSCQNSANLFESQGECQRRCEVPVCSLVANVGNCSSLHLRYSFNAASSRCEEFDYTGCGGNANRFNTLQECQDYCEVDICAQTIDPGPCSAAQTTFIFNFLSGSCQTFTYGGCLGSANRFNTIDDCQDRCRVDLCSLPLESGPCNNFVGRFGYNSATGTCQPFNYGGCLGNANRFTTMLACENRCAVNICLQVEDPGPCSASITAFSFNMNTGTCGPFTYGGCLGGGNRFSDLTLCQGTCEVPIEDPCTQIIDDGICMDNVVRYAYNARSLNCETFQYTGCGGNSNNFLTEAACDQRCLVDVCDQPMAQCAGTDSRWTYDAATNTCVNRFTGNCIRDTGNFFEMFEQCQQRCLVPVCSQDSSVNGPCTGVTRRFTFNSETGNCESFFYTGCGGNANNFIFLQDCEELCEVDTVNPMVTCPSNREVTVEFGTISAVVTWPEPIVSDLNGPVTLIQQSHTSGQTFQIGQTTVTYSYEDAASNVGTCSFQVIVTAVDTINPMVTCPSNPEVIVEFGATSAVVTWTEPTVSDLNEPVTLIQQSHTSGQTFPVGQTTVTYSYQDAASNVGTCSFQAIVTAVDTVNPMVACPSNREVDPEGNTTSAVVRWPEPIVNDLNGPVTLIQQSHTSGQTFPGGQTTVTYSYQDAASNVGNCSFQVTVRSCPLPLQDFFACGVRFCAVHSQCGQGRVCCSNGCFVGMSCVESISVSLNPGNCSAIPAQDPAVCTRECEEDSDCGDVNKCCYTGCGTACMDPI